VCRRLIISAKCFHNQNASGEYYFSFFYREQLAKKKKKEDRRLQEVNFTVCDVCVDGGVKKKRRYGQHNEAGCQDTPQSIVELTGRSEIPRGQEKYGDHLKR